MPPVINGCLIVADFSNSNEEKMSVENIAGAVNLLCLSENEKEKNEIEKEEVIRTKIGEQFRYVFLPVKEMLCYRSFCIKGLFKKFTVHGSTVLTLVFFCFVALDVHGIRESEVELELIDMCGTPIETDKFSKVIQKYLHGDAFCVELVIQNVNINVIIISQVKILIRKYDCNLRKTFNFIIGPTTIFTKWF